VNKFVDGLPLYRQEQIFARIGAVISRATMSAWMLLAAAACKILMDMMIEELRYGDILNMDETTVQVLREPERKTPPNPSCGWPGEDHREVRLSSSTMTQVEGEKSPSTSWATSKAICRQTATPAKMPWRPDPTSSMLVACFTCAASSWT
jgi:hypothetical protein